MQFYMDENKARVTSHDLLLNYSFENRIPYLHKSIPTYKLQAIGICS